MDDLLGKLEMEAPIVSGMLEGSIKLYEKGFVYAGPGINGKAIAYYKYIERLEQLGTLPLGKLEMRMTFFSTFGERFEVRFAISEHYVHELKERKTRGA